MRTAVVGAGRMGLPLACMFGKHGVSVTVCDIDAALVVTINVGQCPYEEPGLADLIGELHTAGRLKVMTDTSRAASDSDAIVVIVPAHLTAEREIDFSILESVSADIG